MKQISMNDINYLMFLMASKEKSSLSVEDVKEVDTALMLYAFMHADGNDLLPLAPIQESNLNIEDKASQEYAAYLQTLFDDTPAQEVRMAEYDTDTDHPTLTLDFVKVD